MSNSSDKILLKTASLLFIGGFAYWAIKRYSNRKKTKVSQVFDTYHQQDQPIKNPLQSTMIQSNVEISRINQQEVKVIDSLAEKLQRLQCKMQLKNVLLNIEQQNQENGSVSSISSLAKIEQYKCPITKKIMVNPAIAFFNCQCRSVNRYQRQAIQVWLDKQNCCPICFIKLAQKCSIKDDQLAKRNILKYNRSINKKICIEKTQSYQIQNAKKQQQPIPEQIQQVNRKRSLVNNVISGIKHRSSIISNVYPGQNQYFNPESRTFDAISEQSEIMRQVPQKVKVEHSVQNYSEDSQATRK